MAAAEVPTGMLADRYGRRVALALGAAAYAVGSAGYALSRSVPLLALSSAIWTVGFALISGADMAVLYDTLQAAGEESSYVRHAGRMQAVMQGAQAAGALVGAPLAAAVSLNAPHLAVALLAVPAVVTSWRLVEPTPDHAAAEPAGRTGGWRELVNALRVPGVLPVVLYGAFLYLLPFFGFYIFLQPYAHALGVGLGWMGVLVVSLRLVSMAASAWSDRLVQGFGDTPLLYGFPLVLAAVAAGVAGGRFPAGLVLLALAIAVGAVSQPLVSHLLNRRVESRVRAGVLSMASFTHTLLLAVLQPLVGAAADRWGIAPALGGLGIVASAACLVVLAAWRPRREPGFGSEAVSP